MPTVSPQNRLERVVPALLGLTVLAFAAGSSSVDAVTRLAHGARWAALFALFVATAVWAGWRTRTLALPVAAIVASVAVVGLALLSTLWSVAPRLTFERAVSLGLLLATAGLLAAAARERPGRARLVLGGLLGGMAAVGLAGLVVLAFAHDSAVERASIETPARFRGLGQNPNTAALLFAVGVPLAIWALLAARGRAYRVLTAGLILLLVGSIVASGSRASLLAAACGALVPAVVAPGRGRGRLLAAVAVGAAAVACALLQQLPDAVAIRPSAPSAHSGKPAPPPRYLDAESSYPLGADVGGPLPGGGQPTVRRSFLSSSGRVQAWEGALRQAAQRPLLGYGFGTETRVFVDRYYGFVAGLPESSYIGMALQLGVVGVLALLALVAVLALPARRVLGGPQRTIVAACLGAVLAGLVLAGAQSYLYSVGNIGAATFWICAFLLTAVVDE